MVDMQKGWKPRELSGPPGIQLSGIESGPPGIESGPPGIESGPPGIESGPPGIESGSPGIQKCRC